MKRLAQITAVAVMLAMISGLIPIGAEAQEEWIQVAAFSGKGGKTTAPFRVTGEKWRVIWTAKAEEPEYAMFAFFARHEGETAMYVANVSQMGVGGDTTYVYEGEGSFYLEVLAANLKKWTIVVEDCVDTALPAATSTPQSSPPPEPPPAPPPPAPNGSGLYGC